MTNIPDKAACVAAGRGTEDGLLPAGPYTSLVPHFGMLLGVDDLETVLAYPRGKSRLHNAWLHGEGVVWGFGVSVDAASHELKVAPGLALDAAGHELHLDAEACLDFGKWYAAHKDEKEFDFQVDAGTGAVTFTAHVVARFTACLTRPVPAIAEPCDGAKGDTAYSRAFETVELLLRPGKAPEKKYPYRRLRILFRLEDRRPDGDGKDDVFDAVKAIRDAVEAKPLADQPKAFLEAFRDLAALDEIDLSPKKGKDGERDSLFPKEPAEVVLADVGPIVLAKTSSGHALKAPPLPDVDVTVRPSHVATSTIQELLCGPLFAGTLPAAFAPPGPLGGGGLGPRVGPLGPKVVEATLSPKLLTLRFDRPIARASLTVDAFSVTSYGIKDGWAVVELKKVVPQSDGSVHVELKESPHAAVVRVLARGTGPAPLLGQGDLRPLGAPGAGGPDDGVDFVKNFVKSS